MYLFKIATNLNLKPEPEICAPRSGGWRVSRRRGRVFSYLAAYVLGLVLGLVCHIGDSSVAGNQLRSSNMLEFFDVLIIVPCTTSPVRGWLRQNILKGCYLSQPASPSAHPGSRLRLGLTRADASHPLSEIIS